MDVAIIVGICLAILFFALFSGIEAAFGTANRLGIELKKKQGTSSGILLSGFFEEPSRLIGTLLVGSNFFLVLFIVMISTYSDVLLRQFGVLSSMKIPARLLIEILSSMIIVIIIGEFIPKAIFRAKSDSALIGLARSGFLKTAYDFFYPVASLFVKVSQWVLTIIFDMRIDKRKEFFKKIDSEHLFHQTHEYHDDKHSLNANLIEAALSLPKVKVRECLVPRKEIEGISVSASTEDLRRKFVDTKLSKLLVFDGNIDQILGYVHQLDLFKQPRSIRDILLPIPAIPESMSATDLISKFSADRKSIAWVVDEFGGTSGIVTMEDMLEEIFGEIKDEYDVEEFDDKKVSEKEYVLSGRLELDYLVEKYGLEFPEDSPETLSGFIIHQYEAIPKLKERIIINDYEFEILHVSDTRIETVRLKILQ